MQQVRLWEITVGRKLLEIPARYASLEEWIEDWLADDISVLDPGLLIIGRQVRTGFGGAIDLLCMDADGNLVVVELKRGQTPRGVTSQALEYASWVKGLGYEDITGIAESYPGIAGTLEATFQEQVWGGPAR
jgi:RecB family endonuclease NucS